MTEAEWLACVDPHPMLAHLGPKANPRRLRLFAVACCRRIPNLQGDEVWTNAYHLAERHADRLVSDKRLRDARKVVRREVVARSGGEHHLVHLPVGGWLLSPDPPYVAIALVVSDLSGVPIPQAALLRCIFGNPFRPPPVIPPAVLKWNGGAVRKLAGSIYEHRTFDQLPVLADALEEAGCTDAELLTHCRSGGEHARRCWVLDLLRGVASPRPQA